MTKQRIAIYLAGSIKKAHENPNESFWTEEDLALLRKGLSQYEVVFLNPAFRTDDLSDQHSVFGRDMLQVASSDIVFVDARDRRGLGVGAEMMWAKFHQIPVVTWAPKNSHYHKSHTTVLGVAVADFIHPFVKALSDQIVEDLMKGAQWIEKTLSSSAEIKGIASIHAAIHYYKVNQLHKDTPMQELLIAGDALTKRINELGLPAAAVSEKFS